LGSPHSRSRGWFLSDSDSLALACPLPPKKGILGSGLHRHQFRDLARRRASDWWAPTAEGSFRRSLATHQTAVGFLRLGRGHQPFRRVVWCPRGADCETSILRVRLPLTLCGFANVPPIQYSHLPNEYRNHVLGGRSGIPRAFRPRSSFPRGGDSDWPEAFRRRFRNTEGPCCEDLVLMARAGRPSTRLGFPAFRED
jgi:hypothetical protein